MVGMRHFGVASVTPLTAAHLYHNRDPITKIVKLRLKQNLAKETKKTKF
jgi:hypothetical protein